VRYAVSALPSRSEEWARRLAGGWFYWPVCLAALSMVALAVLGPVMERRLSLERQCARMQAEVLSLEETEAQLDAARGALQTDPLYQEQVVRHELGVVRPGEIRLPAAPEIGPRATDEEPHAGREFDRPLAILAPVACPSVRLLMLLVGGSVLAAAVLLGLPTKPNPEAGTWNPASPA